VTQRRAEKPKEVKVNPTAGILQQAEIVQEIRTYGGHYEMQSMR
jgi:hypothetical protein